MDQGPFRPVADKELKPIWWLQPVTAYLFEVIPITANPPPGVDAPQVNPLLRKMLYLVRLQPAELQQLLLDIDLTLSDHELIAVKARLISSVRQVYESPWAFPGVLETPDLLRFRTMLKGVSDATRLPANIMASTPAILAASYLSRFSGLTVGNGSYMAMLTNRYYSLYQQRIEAEIALRGISPDTL